MIFALAQIGVGAGFARWLLRRGRWRTPNRFILLLLSLWFLCSGLCELFVSSMEASRDLRDTPTSTIFTLWRGRADSALFVATAALIVVGLPIALWLRLKDKRVAGPSAGDSAPERSTTHAPDISNGMRP